MAEYQMTLHMGGKTIMIPVLPDKLKVKVPGKNETATVLELGEINRIRKKGLSEISWSSFFPLNAAPYVSSSVQLDPWTYVKEIEAHRDSEESCRLSLHGAEMQVNMTAAIESFEYEERGGEPGDIYYTITLKEWKDYSARTVQLPASSGKPAVKSPAKRSGEPEKAKTHTVVAGDCLWAIAQEHYGNGSKYPELYTKNQATIDAKNKGTGNPKYTIYPGQVLKL